MDSKSSLLAMLTASLFGGLAKAEDVPHYELASQEAVWNQVSSDAYATLPQDEVTVAKFFKGLKDRLLERSKSTLVDRNDIIPYFEKLVHPNGICLKGTWNMTEPNPYTGAFRQGTVAPFIGRASTALSNTKAGDNRAFGFAGKIFDAKAGEENLPASTANFFAIEDLGGRVKDHFLDARMTNDIIQISPTLTVFMKSLVGLTVFRDFPKAEGSNLQTALIRELYPISEIGLQPGEQAVTPIWLKIVAAPNMPRIDEEDFRDELQIQHYPEGLTWDVQVASEGSRFGDKQWIKVGQIQIEETIVSASCDHRLHFSHPKARKIY